MSGWLYIVSDPSFETNILKIGWADRDPGKFIVEEQNLTDPSTPLKIEYKAFVNGPSPLKAITNKIVETAKLRGIRDNCNCTLSEAIDLITELTRGQLEFEEYLFNRTLDGLKSFEIHECEGIKFVRPEVETKIKIESGIAHYNQFSDGDTSDRKKNSKKAGYVGALICGVPNGQGKRIYANGDEYVGQWNDGQRHGHGTLSFANGEKYVGGFWNDEFHGQGTFYYSKGHKYVGKWKDSKRHGTGTLTLSDGKIFVGEYRNGKRSG